MKSKSLSAKKPTPKLKTKLKLSPGMKKSNFEKNLSFFRQQEKNASISSLEVANSVNISGKNMLAKFGKLLLSKKSEKPKLNTLRKQNSDRVPENNYHANN
jgi:hypothetical protein